MCNYSICHIHHPFNATQCSTSTIHTRKRPNIIDRTQIRKMALALRTRVATDSFDLVDSFGLTAQVVVVIAVHPLHNINIKINHIYIYFSSSIIPVERRINSFHGQRACFVFFAFATRFIAIILPDDILGHVKLADKRAFFVIQQIHVFVANRIRK